MTAGPIALRAGGAEGVEFGFFAWVDEDTGLVDNVRTSEGQRLGLVLPLVGSYQVPAVWGVIPPGYEVTLATRGDFFATFPNGATKGQQVFASTVDGSPISGETAGAQATPWYVVTDAPPGGLAIISTWSH